MEKLDALLDESDRFEAVPAPLKLFMRKIRDEVRYATPEQADDVMDQSLVELRNRVEAALDDANKRNDLESARQIRKFGKLAERRLLARERDLDRENSLRRR